jgi:hypothetical protein
LSSEESSSESIGTQTDSDITHPSSDSSTESSTINVDNSSQNLSFGVNKYLFLLIITFISASNFYII